MSARVQPCIEYIKNSEQKQSPKLYKTSGNTINIKTSCLTPAITYLPRRILISSILAFFFSSSVIIPREEALSEAKRTLVGRRAFDLT